MSFIKLFIKKRRQGCERLHKFTSLNFGCARAFAISSGCDIFKLWAAKSLAAQVSVYYSVFFFLPVLASFTVFSGLELPASWRTHS